MLNILVIDDLRIFLDFECQYARTSIDAINILNDYGPWDEVWFDHDLGEHDHAGHVLYFLELCNEGDALVEIDRCIVHTANPAGAKSLVAGLSKMYNTERISALNLNVTSLEIPNGA